MVKKVYRFGYMTNKMKLESLLVNLIEIQKRIKQAPLMIMNFSKNVTCDLRGTTNVWHDRMCGLPRKVHAGSICIIHVLIVWVNIQGL